MSGMKVIVGLEIALGVLLVFVLVSLMLNLRRVRRDESPRFMEPGGSSDAQMMTGMLGGTIGDHRHHHAPGHHHHHHHHDHASGADHHGSSVDHGGGDAGGGDGGGGGGDGGGGGGSD